MAFQPHLYSRTRDFADEFADALSAADEVILIDLYPAREQPYTRNKLKNHFRQSKCAQKRMISKEDFVGNNEK